MAPLSCRDLPAARLPTLPRRASATNHTQLSFPCGRAAPRRWRSLTTANTPLAATKDDAGVASLVGRLEQHDVAHAPYHRDDDVLLEEEEEEEDNDDDSELRTRWREIHGCDDWAGLLDPMDPLLRSELIRYGELAQACYDAFDYDPSSRYCGSCKYPRRELFSRLGMDGAARGYSVSRYLFATSNIRFPNFFPQSRAGARIWSQSANWIGYVAVSTDAETARLGRRDIAVAWRGTVTRLEWVSDFMDFLRPVAEEGIPCPDPDVKVLAGFVDLYTDRDPTCRFCKYSAREQVLTEVRRLVGRYAAAGEDVSITVTGHSLGSALAMLSAYDIAETGANVAVGEQGAVAAPVCVYSFGGPRVGNAAFKRRFEAELGVKVLRVVNVHDNVTRMPGIFLNERAPEAVRRVAEGLLRLPWCYAHVGVELPLDHKRSPFLKDTLDPACCHDLEAHLHLIDGIQSANSAISASSSEGADFLIVNTGTGDFADVMNDGVGQIVKIPIFFTLNHLSEGTYTDFTSRLLQSGASGVVTSLAGMQLLTDELIKKDFTKVDSAQEVPQASYSSAGMLKDDNNVMVLTRDREKTKVAGFTKLDERVVQLIEIEKPILNEAIAIIRKAAPMMEEVELLVDAASRLSEPFLLVTVGEFNSGKSTFINALLGRKYLQEGVVPTTNEITLLSYSEIESESFERCERHPDGQFMCYLSVPILKEMNLVDTPGTNVILQRQQRLTEEYVPRADLILFVLSSDRPLTESEVGFLQYVQQWKKKVVFVLNKLDLYRNSNELDEATAFVKENAMKLLNAEDVTLFPVSSRSALEAKLSYSKSSDRKHSREAMFSDPRWRSSKFCELEDYLLSFLDSSTENGKERVRLKLETPIGIADRLLTSCQRLVKLEYEKAVEDLTAINDLVYGANNYAIKLESDSKSWQNQISSLIERAKGRAVKLMESTLRLSNIDLIFTYTVKAKTGSSTRATSFVQNDILSPTLDDAVNLLGDYSTWLSSSNAREAEVYLECFCGRWDALVAPEERVLLDPNGLVNESEKLTTKALDGFNASAAAKVFEEEIREVAFGTFGGLGIAGLSASLLTSVLATTLEDLLALALCSAGGFFVLSSFPGRRKLAIEKVNKAAEELSRKVDEAIQKDISQSATNLIRFVEVISKPYQEACQRKIDWLQGVQGELSAVERKLQTLKVEIQNLHGS